MTDSQGVPVVLRWPLERVNSWLGESVLGKKNRSWSADFGFEDNHVNHYATHHTLENNTDTAELNQAPEIMDEAHEALARFYNQETRRQGGKNMKRMRAWD